MNIDKDTILNLLRGNEQDTQAVQGKQQLPDQIDTEQHARPAAGEVRGQPADLITKFTGGQGDGGIGGALCKLL